MKAFADYVVVGSGLTGATIARMLHDAGREVVVVERRSQVGGNVVDHTGELGIRVHTYGPHHWRTNDEQLAAWFQRFAEFYRFDWWVMSKISPVKVVNWPVTETYMEQEFGKDWKPELPPEYVAKNFEEASLKMMPRVVYERFVKTYTEKQWGKPATELSTTLAGRFAVNPKGEVRLKTHKYQGLPVDGYSAMMRKMLEGIPTILNVDWLQCRRDFAARELTVYTGPVDALFDHDEGRLAYRGQKRKHVVYEYVEGFIQPAPAVNRPGPEVAWVRELEWKRMMRSEDAAAIHGTIVTTETPWSPVEQDDLEYPVPDAANTALAESYKKRAAALPATLVVGRLGEYRYFDMDQAVARAGLHAGRILGVANPFAGVSMEGSFTGAAQEANA